MLSHSQYKFWQSLSVNKQGSLGLLTDEEAREEVKRLMFKRKEWDDSILSVGGISYITIEGKRYRVAQTYKGRFNEVQHTKILKYKVRTASGEIFSVSAKTQSEAQAVVNNVFGKGHYRVSEALV